MNNALHPISLSPSSELVGQLYLRTQVAEVFDSMTLHEATKRLLLRGRTRHSYERVFYGLVYADEGLHSRVHIRGLVSALDLLQAFVHESTLLHGSQKVRLGTVLTPSKMVATCVAHPAQHAVNHQHMQLVAEDGHILGEIQVGQLEWQTKAERLGATIHRWFPAHDLDTLVGQPHEETMATAVLERSILFDRTVDPNANQSLLFVRGTEPVDAVVQAMHDQGSPFAVVLEQDEDDVMGIVRVHDLLARMLYADPGSLVTQPVGEWAIAAEGDNPIQRFQWATRFLNVEHRLWIQETDLGREDDNNSDRLTAQQSSNMIHATVMPISLNHKFHHWCLMDNDIRQWLFQVFQRLDLSRLDHSSPPPYTLSGGDDDYEGDDDDDSPTPTHQGPSPIPRSLLVLLFAVSGLATTAGDQLNTWFHRYYAPRIHASTDTAPSPPSSPSLQPLFGSTLSYPSSSSSGSSNPRPPGVNSTSPPQSQPQHAQQQYQPPPLWSNAIVKTTTLQDAILQHSREFLRLLFGSHIHRYPRLAAVAAAALSLMGLGVGYLATLHRRRRNRLVRHQQEQQQEQQNLAETLAQQDHEWRYRFTFPILETPLTRSPYTQRAPGQFSFRIQVPPTLETETLQQLGEEEEEEEELGALAGGATICDRQYHGVRVSFVGYRQLLEQLRASACYGERVFELPPPWIPSGSGISIISNSNSGADSDHRRHYVGHQASDSPTLNSTIVSTEEEEGDDEEDEVLNLIQLYASLPETDHHGEDTGLLAISNSSTTVERDNIAGVPEYPLQDHPTSAAVETVALPMATTTTTTMQRIWLAPVYTHYYCGHDVLLTTWNMVAAVQGAMALNEDHVALRFRAVTENQLAQLATQPRNSRGLRWMHLRAYEH